jgi:hypothetical protein
MLAAKLRFRRLPPKPLNQPQGYLNGFSNAHRRAIGLPVPASLAQNLQPVKMQTHLLCALVLYK